ncbi:hypothetical protein [Methanobrevibacter sp.]|uniref:hypothetical protein n=1 Tax=Methanobrevibacter sp. TaxID=66852 RepID=UPI00388EFFC8
MKTKYLIVMLFIFILSLAAVSANELDENQIDENDAILPVDSTDNNMDNSTIIGNDLVKYYKNDSQYEVQVFDENHTKLNNTHVEFSVNGNTYVRTVKDGIARININLNPGDYKITAKNCYDNTTVTNNITVLSTIISSDLTKYFKNASQFKATVLDGLGNPESGVNVLININGVYYKRTTDKTGTAKLNINLNPGKYTLTVGREDTGLKMASNVRVLPTLLCNDLVKYYRNASQFKATLLDEAGNPAANAKMTLNINGVYYKRTTDENGTAKLNINLNPGTYILTAEQDTTGLKMSAKVTVLPTILCNDLVKYFKNASQVNVKVLDDMGNPLKNSKLTLNINGVFYTRTTDNEGNAKLNINLQPGDYILTVERLDNHLKVLSNIKVLPKLIARDVNTCTEGKAFPVKLVNDVGKPEVGKRLTGSINGETFYATTNSEGIATFQLSFLTKGYYTITVSYGENIISNKLLVEKGTVSVIRNLGNPNAPKIAYVVGLHPLEHRTHETLLKILPTIPGLNYCYDVYVIQVTEDIGYYGDGLSNDKNPGRQNGQYLAYNYVYPQILKGGYKLTVDVHSNVGYGVPAFVFSPVTGGAGERYARTVASNCANVNYYQISTTTSAPYLTIPLNQNGIPAFYYEEYSFEPQSSMDMHMTQLLYAVDGLKF